MKKCLQTFCKTIYRHLIHVIIINVNEVVNVYRTIRVHIVVNVRKASRDASANKVRQQPYCRKRWWMDLMNFLSRKPLTV